MKTFNFATLNVRGLKKIPNNDGPPNKDSNSLDLHNITTDLQKHDIDAIALQETHFKASEHLQNVKGYIGYFSNDEDNRYHGIGILVKDIYHPTFTKISARVSAASFKISDKKDILFICGYAPHESLSNNKPEERDLFYNHIEKALALKKSTTIPILALDANAQIAYENQETPHGILGKFTKGNKTNNNGQKLLHLAAENELTITNTLFQHKMSRRTTWTAPFRNIRTTNGKKRRNPIHNQIDFILIDKKYARFLKNARSYNNIATDSDHNMVITNINFEFTRLNKPKVDKPSKVNIANFRNKALNQEYLEKVNEQFDAKDATNNNERWQKVVETCLTVGEEVLGNKEEKTLTDKDKEIKRLSEMRKTIKRQITDSTSTRKIESLKKERQYIKKEINYRIKKAEEKEIDEKMAHIENIKDDNTSYHYAMREINRPTQKVPILVKDSQGNVPGSTSAKI